MHIKVGDIDDYKYNVIDLSTGDKISFCLEANDETGEYTYYVVDKDGNFKFNEGETELLTETKIGKIKLVKVK